MANEHFGNSFRHTHNLSFLTSAAEINDSWIAGETENAL